MDDTVEIVNDGTDEWEAAFGAAIARGLEQVGLAAECHAKAICPVDTMKSPKVIVWVEHHPELGYDLLQQDERDDNERHLQQTER